MVTLESRLDGEPLGRLGWITAVDVGEHGQLVELLVGNHAMGPFRPPEDGFRRDAFGVGAQALVTRDGYSIPCTVRCRKGPVALVELADESQSWVPVILLTLRGEGRDPGDDVEAEVVLAPWALDRALYPAVIVHGEEDEGAPVRAAYLDASTAWVQREALRPLPRASERAHYTDPDGTKVATIVVDYPGLWVVGVAAPSKDGTKRLVALNRLYVAGSDQER